MLFALQDGLKTIVGAATTMTEYDEFRSSAIASQTLGHTAFKTFEQPDIIELIDDAYLSQYSYPPFVFTHENADQAAAFVAGFKLTLLKPNGLLDKHIAMMAAYRKELEAQNPTEQKTIGEMFGLTENDPWDTRTDEQREQDEKFKKVHKDAKKGGRLSGDDSFSAPDPKDEKDKARIRKIEVTTDADGNVSVDRVIAEKGLHANADADRIAAEAAVAAGLPIPRAKQDDIGDADPELVIATDGKISTYFKVEVLDAKLADTMPVLEAAAINVNKITAASRDYVDGCWFACVFKRLAQEIETVLADAGFTVEVYGSNQLGERLVPKGTEVVDTKQLAPEPPRPWNHRAAELEVMSEDECKKNEESLKGSEFLYCAFYEGPDVGTVIYVVPGSWFAKHGEAYPVQLDLSRLLPQDFEPVAGKTNIFVAKYRDLAQVQNELGRVGMIDEWFWNLYINNL